MSYVYEKGLTKGYLRLSGASGERVTIPDASSLDITGDMTVIFRGSFNTRPAAAMVLVDKYATGAGNVSWYIYVSTTGFLYFGWSEDGTTTNDVNSTVALASGTFAGGIAVSLDVNGGVGGAGLIRFYTSTDGYTWAQLGADRSGGSVPTSIASTGSDVHIGGTLANPFAGDVNSVQIFSEFWRNYTHAKMNVQFGNPASLDKVANTFVDRSFYDHVATIGGSAWEYHLPPPGLHLGLLQNLGSPQSAIWEGSQEGRFLTMVSDYWASDIDDAKWFRDQLDEYVKSGMIIPVYWDEDTSVNGWYRIVSAQSSVLFQTGEGFVDFTVTLQWIGGAEDVDWETRYLWGDRHPNVTGLGATTSYALIIPPQTVRRQDGFLTGAGYGFLNRPVTNFEPSYGDHITWNVLPDRVFTSTSGSAVLRWGGRPLVGKAVPPRHDITTSYDAGTAWSVSSYYCRVEPSTEGWGFIITDTMGHKFTHHIQQVAVAGTVSTWTTASRPKYTEIVRNTPAEVVLRQFGELSGDAGTLDIRLRRAERYVEFSFKHPTGEPVEELRLWTAASATSTLNRVWAAASATDTRAWCAVIGVRGVTSTLGTSTAHHYATMGATTERWWTVGWTARADNPTAWRNKFFYWQSSTAVFQRDEVIR